MADGGVKIDTIEKLAALVADGFYDVHTRMDTMEQRLDKKIGDLTKKVDDGFEGVNARMEGVNRRIDDEVDQRIELGLRVEKVEAKVFPELRR